MTTSRHKIESSLAARGRPALWANEQESAVLSGYSPEAFRDAICELEPLGFPQKNALNGFRYIPAIEAFWACQVEFGGIPAQDADDDGPDGPKVEKFDASQRR